LPRKVNDLAVHRMHGLEAHATITFSGLRRDSSQWRIRRVGVRNL